MIAFAALLALACHVPALVVLACILRHAAAHHTPAP